MPIALEVLGNVNISRVNIGSYVAWAFCAKIVHTTICTVLHWNIVPFWCEFIPFNFSLCICWLHQYIFNRKIAGSFSFSHLLVIIYCSLVYLLAKKISMQFFCQVSSSSSSWPFAVLLPNRVPLLWGQILYEVYLCV